MELVDWDLAIATSRRLTRPGPRLTGAFGAATRAELSELAAEAFGHVTAYTGLVPDPRLRTSIEVVDRATWAAYNVAGMRQTLAPLLDTLSAKRKPERDGSLAHRAARAVTGAELGGLVSVLASRVLGQYEVFLPPEDGAGRLLLVAPNIVDAERRLEVDPRDFRMWVALHEQTHHVQFTSAPWLNDHLRDLVRQLAEASNLDAAQLRARLLATVKELRSRSGEPRGGGVFGALQTPRQRAVLEQIQAAMTLIEGHADQVMDAVGPRVVPSVTEIRARFEARRRRGGSPLDRLLRRVLGLDAKLAQYRVGGAFCRAVTAAGGPDAMRLAFAGPEHVPSMAELRDPATWLARLVPSAT